MSKRKASAHSGIVASRSKLRDHAIARPLIGNRIEDRVERKQRVARKIHLGDQTRNEGVPEQREMDVGRAPSVIVIAPGIGTGFHRDELVIAGLVGLGAAGAGEVRIERRGMLIDDVDVAPARVRLPDFDKRVGDRPAVLVEHAPMHDDPLPDRLAPVLSGQVLVAGLHRVLAVDWSGQFAQRMRDDDERLGRRPFHGALVVGIEARRESPEALGRGKKSRHRDPWVVRLIVGFLRA